MKLLFDHNLSHKLVPRLADLFPQASHTRLTDLTSAPDFMVWDFARRGNQPTAFYEKLLRARQARIAEWLQDPAAGGLEIYAEEETAS